MSALISALLQRQALQSRNNIPMQMAQEMQPAQMPANSKWYEILGAQLAGGLAKGGMQGWGQNIQAEQDADTMAQMRAIDEQERAQALADRQQERDWKTEDRDWEHENQWQPQFEQGKKEWAATHALNQASLGETKRYHNASLALQIRDIKSRALEAAQKVEDTQKELARTGQKDVMHLIGQDKTLRGYSTSMQYYNTMVAGLEDPSAVSDQVFAVSLAKILDPTSVVREGEAYIFRTTQGIPDVVSGMLEKTINGGAELSRDTRARMIQQGYNVIQPLAEQAIGKIDSYRSYLDAQTEGHGNWDAVAPQTQELELPRSVSRILRNSKLGVSRGQESNAPQVFTSRDGKQYRPLGNGKWEVLE